MRNAFPDGYQIFEGRDMQINSHIFGDEYFILQVPRELGEHRGGQQRTEDMLSMINGGQL